jgi:putative transposase
MFQLFVTACAQAFPDSCNILLLANRGAPTSFQLPLPENGRCVSLPPYCPQLKPIARVWRDRKDARAWLHVPNLDAQQDYLATLLQAYEAAMLQALTGFTSLVEAIHALGS